MHLMSIPRPTIPTGRELYDIIMTEIEPDLTSTGRTTWAVKYLGETPEQCRERYRRYDLAFERYDKAYDEYMQMLNTQVDRYRHGRFQEIEDGDRRRESEALSSLQLSFAQAS